MAFSTPIRKKSIVRTIRQREINVKSHYLSRNLFPLNSLKSDSLQKVQEVRFHEENAMPITLAVSKHAHITACATEQGELYFYRLHHDKHANLDEENTPAHHFQAHLSKNMIFDVKWFDGDRQIATACADKSSKLFDVESGQCTSQLTGHTGSVKSIAISAERPHLVISGARDGNVNVYDTRMGVMTEGEENSLAPVISMRNVHCRHKDARRSNRGNPPTGAVTAVTFFASDVLFATGSDSGSEVKVWDARRPEQVFDFTPPITSGDVSPQSSKCGGVSNLAVDRSGTRLLANCVDSNIYVYDVNSWASTPAVFSGHYARSYYVKANFSPDGEHIISGSTDGHVCLWHIDEKTPHQTVCNLIPVDTIHTFEVSVAAFYPGDMSSVLSLSDDGVLRLWKANWSL